MTHPRRQPLSSWLQQLRAQHVQDLKVYRNNHKEWRNRVLHWIMIPLECWSALLLLSIVALAVHGWWWSTPLLGTIPSNPSAVSQLIVFVVGIGLGLLSWMIATQPFIGYATLLFHGIAAWTCHEVMANMKPMEAIFIALSTWTMAWIFQVGIGHWIWEGNQPNVANMDDVSWLAMIQSVLIAWSS